MAKKRFLFKAAALLKGSSTGQQQGDIQIMALKGPLNKCVNDAKDGYEHWQRG